MNLAWHFVRNVKGRLLLRDGREVPPLGEWLTHDGPVAICESGLHASYRALYALQYCEWEHAAACLVEVDDVIAERSDKLVCRRRRVVAVVRDADETLRLFARCQALSVIHMWDAPAVVNARSAARSAARAAARAAAWAAARDVAWVAAWVATWDAARDELESLLLGQAEWAPGCGEGTR